MLGPQHPDTLQSMNNLATLYGQEGKYAQAEVLFSQNLEIKRSVLGPQHPDTLYSAANLAVAYQLQGKYRAGGGAFQPDPGDPAPHSGPRASLDHSDSCGHCKHVPASRQIRCGREVRRRDAGSATAYCGLGKPGHDGRGGRPGTGVRVSGEICGERAAGARGC